MAETKEWTLMFYLASDNPLAPGVVSQLKAIKQAGYHHNANVIAQFDPQTAGTPTHIFDVNLVSKLKKPGTFQIGFGDDPSVRNLMEDKLWRDQKDRKGRSIKAELKRLLEEDAPGYNPPAPPDGMTAIDPATRGRRRELDPKVSLGNFLKFCRDEYPARHYMLFILGHGVVVCNDVFLFDENAVESSLSLKELGELLSNFKLSLLQGEEFELVSFHSCSVSSLEVAYELKGTANYMLASQGPAFVGSWPYRQILMRVFLDLEASGGNIPPEKIKEMLVEIFNLCLQNSTDFLLAGYSFDLCLCNLSKVTGIKSPLEKLSIALAHGLGKPLIRELILLSHWRAQSYWQESYTDLYDFCLCLTNLCKGFEEMARQMPETLADIKTACKDVKDELVKGIESDDDRLIVRAECAGPAYQYSHGVSVFFPWSKLSSDSPFMEEYKDYKFEETSWRVFLERYFVETMRDPQKTEDDAHERPTPILPPSDAELLFEDMVSLVYNEEGQLSNDNALARGDKTNPSDPTGDACTCPSIKNYPRDTRASRARSQRAGGQATLTSRTFFKEFWRRDS